MISANIFVETVVSERSCTSEGKLVKTCSICGETEVKTEEAYGHNYTDWYLVKAATCIEAGELARECMRCGEIEKVEIYKDTHNYGEGEVIDPTCDAEGYTVYTCKDCGEIYITNKVPATGHKDKNDDFICDNCGAEIERTGMDAYRCKMCPAYEANKDIPFVGFFYKIVHYFVHLAHYIGHLT